MARLKTAFLLGLLLLPVATSAQEPATVRQASSQSKGAKRHGGAKSPKTKLSKKDRRAFIQKAQVWVPTNVSAMDIRMGPQGQGSFPPNATVTCDYFETKLSGSSAKFDCRIGESDVVKVRYGIRNGEVYGAVLASRLLWALGFGADRVYMERVTCRGCSSDPWNKRDKSAGEQVFDPAAIERKPEGREMDTSEGSGWGWPELALVDETKGGAPRSQLDALTLLAVFIQHTDSKPDQQRLLCLPGGTTADGACTRPFLMVHDVGLTFGHANWANSTDTGSVNFVEWSTTPVWRDAQKCIGHLSKSSTGTLGDPAIHEAGRAFLADLLVQLTDKQLHDLFDAARVELRSRKPNDERLAAAGGERGRVGGRVQAQARRDRDASLSGVTTWKTCGSSKPHAGRISPEANRDVSGNRLPKIGSSLPTHGIVVLSQPKSRCLQSTYKRKIPAWTTSSITTSSHVRGS